MRGDTEGLRRGGQVLQVNEGPSDAALRLGLHLVPHPNFDPFEGISLLQRLCEEVDGPLEVGGVVRIPVDGQFVAQLVLALLDRPRTEAGTATTGSETAGHDDGAQAKKDTRARAVFSVQCHYFLSLTMLEPDSHLSIVMERVSN